jgi:hypothetical protein
MSGRVFDAAYNAEVFTDSPSFRQPIRKSTSVSMSKEMLRTDPSPNADPMTACGLPNCLSAVSDAGRGSESARGRV